MQVKDTKENGTRCRMEEKPAENGSACFLINKYSRRLKGKFAKNRCNRWKHLIPKN